MDWNGDGGWEWWGGLEDDGGMNLGMGMGGDAGGNGMGMGMGMGGMNMD